MLIDHICLLLEKKLQIFLTRVQIPFSFLTIMLLLKQFTLTMDDVLTLGCLFIFIHCQFPSVNS